VAKKWVMRENIELMRLSHPECFVVDSTRSSLRGIDQDIAMRPAHTNDEPSGRGKALRVDLDGDELRHIINYWYAQLDDYKELVDAWRLTQPTWQRMSGVEWQRSFHSWQPDIPLSSSQSHMHSHPITTAATIYNRCEIAGIHFKVQRVSGSDPTLLPHSIIAAPWEDRGEAGIPVIRLAYGIIQNIILHEPWPNADPTLELPDASLLLRVRWYPPTSHHPPHEYGLPVVSYNARSIWNRDPITPLEKIAHTNILFTHAPTQRFPSSGGERVFYALDLRHSSSMYPI